MSPGRLSAGALVFAAHLLFAPASHADGSANAAPAATQVAPTVQRSDHSPSTLAALAAAGFVPAILMIARDRRRARNE